MERKPMTIFGQFVKTDEVLKTYDGPLYAAIAKQVAYYAGLNPDLVDINDNVARIRIAGFAFSFLNNGDTVPLEIFGLANDLALVTFMITKADDVYTVVNLVTKALGLTGITELQILKHLQILAKKAGMDYRFTYEKTTTGDYGLVFTVSNPKVEAFKERFTILAFEKDMTFIIACVADSDKLDGFLAESDSAAIAIGQACSYILSILTSIGANLLKPGGAQQPRTVQ